MDQLNEITVKAILEALGGPLDLVCVVDSEGLIRARAAGPGSAFGPDDLAEGTVVREIIHEADLHLVEAALAGLEQGPTDLERVRFTLVGHEESIRCRIWVQPLADSGGAALLLIRDISAEIELAAELDLNRRQLEEALKTKNTLFSSVSHELRTPLNAIIGFIEMLKMGLAGPVTEQQVEYLSHTVEAANHLLTLINDILDLSKVEAGKLELEIKEFNLAELIRSSTVLFKEKSIRHKINVELEIDEEVGLVQADERKIKQVLYNLLANSFKFTPDGGRIGIRADLEEGKVRIEVKDSGFGIPPGELASVFKPFHQADNQAQTDGKGTGLGLSLSKELIRLHGGKIWAESEGRGTGATFTFLIPIRSRMSLEALIERELESARDNNRVLSVILLRVHDFQQIKDFYTDVEMKAFISAVNDRVRRSTREQFDRYYVFEQTGIWVVLTPQEAAASQKTGERCLANLTGGPFAKEVRLKADMEVAATYVPQEEEGGATPMVLVVDDDPALRDVLSGIIKASGLEAEAVAGGHQALELLAKKPYDLLISDLMMPEMHGSELIRTAREQGYDGPVLLITGFEGARDEASKIPNVDQIMKKPFSFAELKEAVTRLVGRFEEAE